MEELAPVLLQHIFLFLDPLDFFSTIPCINKFYSSIITSDYTYKSYFSNYFHTTKPIKYLFPQVRSIIYNYLSQSSAQELKFEGFATNGGVDDDGDIWWVDNLFQDNASTYCSRESKPNINCAAVLKHAILDPESENQISTMKDEIARLMRGSQALRDILIRDVLETEGPLSQMEELLFIELWSQAPHVFIDQMRRNRSERLKEVRKLTGYYERLIDMKPKIRNLKVNSTDNFLLAKPLNHDGIRSTNYLALINEVVFSRAGEFTCPVQTFLLFVSDEYVPVDSEEFNMYDNLNELSEVIHLTSHDNRVPSLVRSEEQDDLYYAEFDVTYNRLKPLVWCKFKRSGDNFKLTLKNRFSGVYFYAKLVNPENRMAEMGDQHSDTNIDASYAGLKGKLIDLSSVDL